jgi:hypothetical protein
VADLDVGGLAEHGSGATASALSWRPVTVKCMPMRVKTFGSVSARSADILTLQPVTACRPRLRISTTS